MAYSTYPTYEGAAAYILGLPKFTKKNSPSHTKALMGLLGNPQDRFAYVHVAGSNGKGSVCAYLTRVMMEGNIRVGTFTSPHLMDMRERFCIQGRLCGKRQFLKSFEAVQCAVQQMQAEGLPHPTFFEWLYAMAMDLFAREQVACAVVETGLGGRLDATNVRESPTASVITSISLEHTEILGETIEQIAWEKAGILKPGVTAVFDGCEGQAAAVIRRRAKELGAPALEVTEESIHILSRDRKGTVFSLDWADDAAEDGKLIPDIIPDSVPDSIWISATAPYQVRNAALALAAMRALRRREPLFSDLSPEAVRRGFAKAFWPGRMEEIYPNVFLDGAHNVSGVQAFLEAAEGLFQEKAILLFSMVAEKDYHKALGLLCQAGLWEEIIFTEIPESARALSAESLLVAFLRQPGADGVRALAIADAREALGTAQAHRKPNQMLFCAGSLYLIGALRGYLGTE